MKHWLQIGQRADADKLLKIFLVNWFRRDAEGSFLAGFGENSRVLKWMVDRIAGRVDARKTPIGYLPQAEDIDVAGLDTKPEAVEQSLAVSTEEWQAELGLLQE